MKDVLNKILPPEICVALSHLEQDKLTEIRLRCGGKASVGYAGGYAYLSPHGVTDVPDFAFSVSAAQLQGIMERACDKSLYAYNDRICQGYVTLRGGVRIGIAGETVWDEGQIKTVKNFSSLAVRIPHEVIGCGEKVAARIRKPNGYHSTLVLSPPGAGKTTLLRDLARIASSRRPIRNVLVCDERDEIAAAENGVPTLNVGQNTDVLAGCGKEYAFLRGIRALRPDIIVTDELCGAQDAAAVENAVASGVCVFASVHADSVEALARKRAFASLLQNGTFSRYVVVSATHGPGTVEEIYDADLHPVRDAP